jgi:uncharacterized 2Fe-2S/4Fe-4S cluster protein (DUF4445 family)
MEFVLVWGRETGIEQDLVITQKDISEIQMAKAAIHAGAVLLQETLGEQPVERILLAGAGGNYIDPKDACTLGLFPGCDTAEVMGVGNAAGYGACLALMDTRKRTEADRIAKKVEYIELAAAGRFQELFVSSMFFRAAHDYEDSF